MGFWYVNVVVFSSNSYPHCPSFLHASCCPMVGSLFIVQRAHPYAFVSQIHALSFTYFSEDRKILFLWPTFPDLHRHMHIFLYTHVCMCVYVVCMHVCMFKFLWAHVGVSVCMNMPSVWSSWGWYWEPSLITFFIVSEEVSSPWSQSLNKWLVYLVTLIRALLSLSY